MENSTLQTELNLLKSMIKGGITNRSEMVILSYLMASDAKYLEVKQEDIAKATGYKQAAVSRSLKSLERSNVVTLKRGTIMLRSKTQWKKAPKPEKEKKEKKEKKEESEMVEVKTEK